MLLDNDKRYDYYVFMYRRAVNILLVLSLLNFILVVVLIYLSTKQPDAKYFSSSSNGVITSMIDKENYKK